MLYKGLKIIVHSSDGDTDFFDIIAGVLQGDALTPFLFLICLDYVQRISIEQMKENSLTLKDVRSKRNPAETFTDEDHAYDQVLRANIATQDESVQHRMKQPARGISLCVNSN